MTLLRRLILVRHAKSAYPEGVRDHERPLNARGRRDAPEIGVWLNDHVGIEPGSGPVVLVSSATRAQQTWSLAAHRLSDAWARRLERTEPAIYEASLATLLRIIDTAPADSRTLILVGHNPGLADVVADLGVEGPVRAAAIEKFPTSSVAVLETPDSWVVGTALPHTWAVSAFAVPRGL